MLINEKILNLPSKLKKILNLNFLKSLIKNFAFFVNKACPLILFSIDRDVKKILSDWRAKSIYSLISLLLKFDKILRAFSFLINSIISSISELLIFYQLEIFLYYL